MKIPSKEVLIKELKETEFAKKITEKEFVTINENIHFLSYSKGETIFKQGSSINEMAILMRGLAKVTIENSSKKNGTIITIQKSISLFGTSFLFDSVYPATATAMCDSIVAFVNKETFSRIIKNNNSALYAFLERNCKDLRQGLIQLVDYGQKSIKSRLACAILYLTDIIDNDFIDIPISRNDLAEYAGIATGSTIRLLSEMAKDDLIILDKKTIKIKNKNELIRISKLD